VISIILPANNEEVLIRQCLTSLLASEGVKDAVEIILVANGCRDKTVQVAEDYIDLARKKGWAMQVVDLPEGGKIRALNYGDMLARYGARVYLDADVIVSPLVLKQMCQALKSDQPRYVSGRIQITAPNDWVSCAYAKFYRLVPFMAEGVPGCGLFAVNAAGRAKWGVFPDIISDDTYVRLQFSPSERVGVEAPYDWPIVKGFGNLVRVRKRQNAGVDEVNARYPELAQNDNKAPFGIARLSAAIAKTPIGFVCYSAVAAAVRLAPQRDVKNWSRGR